MINIYAINSNNTKEINRICPYIIIKRNFSFSIKSN